jgi:hypothetical protein
MPIERLIDELIEAGWSVLESNFDERAFALWRLSAHQCVAALLASDDPCPQPFQDHVNEPHAGSFLARGDIFTP